MTAEKSLGVIALCAMSSLISPSSAAQEGIPETLESASASVLANHPEGCVLFNLHATQGRQPDSVPLRLLTLSVFKDSSRASCASMPSLQLLAVGTVESFDLSINPSLADATLRAVVPARTTAGTTITFTLDIKWSGVGGQPIPMRNFASSLSIAHGHGYQRPASIVAVVSDGGLDYLASPFSSDGSLNVITTLQSASPRR